MPTLRHHLPAAATLGAGSAIPAATLAGAISHPARTAKTGMAPTTHSSCHGRILFDGNDRVRCPFARVRGGHSRIRARLRHGMAAMPGQDRPTCDIRHPQPGSSACLAQQWQQAPCHLRPALPFPSPKGGTDQEVIPPARPDEWNRTVPWTGVRRGRQTEGDTRT